MIFFPELNKKKQKISEMSKLENNQKLSRLSIHPSRCFWRLLNRMVSALSIVIYITQHLQVVCYFAEINSTYSKKNIINGCNIFHKDSCILEKEETLEQRLIKKKKKSFHGEKHSGNRHIWACLELLFSLASETEYIMWCICGKKSCEKDRTWVFACYICVK